MDMPTNRRATISSKAIDKALSAIKTNKATSSMGDIVRPFLESQPEQSEQVVECMDLLDWMVDYLDKHEIFDKEGKPLKEFLDSWVETAKQVLLIG